jgi:hypothetical protein
MRENKFRTILSKVTTDSAADQRITEYLLNYPELSQAGDKSNKHSKLLFSLTSKHRLPLFYHISKTAAAIVLLTILGTATAWAAGYFVKSYPIDMQIKQVEDLTDYMGNGPKPEKTTTLRFGDYEIRSTVYWDADGNIIEPDANGNIIDKDGSVLAYGDKTGRVIASYKDYDPTKGAKEVFELIGLPDIIPTYLYENYKLDPGGYIYKEEEFTDRTVKQIAALFEYRGYQKSVCIYYRPVGDTVDTKESLYIIEGDISDYEKTTYTTKTGLLCNILYTKGPNKLSSAEIHFTDAALGDGIYSFSFDRIEMDEIKAILDSIPMSSPEQQ